MRKTTNRRDYKPLEILLAAAPLAVLRPIITEAARETLIQQSQQNLAQLQKEWAKDCVPTPLRNNSLLLRLRQVAFGGVAVAPIASGAKRGSWDLFLVAYAGIFGLIGISVIENEITENKRAQQLVQNTVQATSPKCISLKAQITDAEAAIAELAAGRKPAPTPQPVERPYPPFPHKMRIAVTADAVAKVGLMATVGAALVYSVKTATAGIAGFASALTPRSVLENLDSEQSNSI